MRKVITRAAILTGAILFANVAVESAAPAPAPAIVKRASARLRQVTVPAGTVLRLRLTHGFGSDSRLEAPVSATLVNPIVVDGHTVLRQGSVASGYVSEAVRPGRVKGRGRVAVRFTRISPVGVEERYNMQTRSWVAVEPAPKRKE